MVKRAGFRNMRVGGTSWVIRGSLADNLRHLSSGVSDMEVVLFDSNGCSNMPSRAEVEELRRICGDLGMTCTVHFPADISPHLEETSRVRNEEMCLRTIDLFAPLEPFAWIMHIMGDLRGKEPSADMKTWHEEGRKSADRIARAVTDKKSICLETLDYDFAHAEAIVRDLGLSVCLDIGHMVKFGHSARSEIKRLLPCARVIHAHGVRPDGTDHVDLSFFDASLLAETIAWTDDGSERVMTMEVFESDYPKSLDVINDILRDMPFA